jgi:hypothetical protein
MSVSGHEATYAVQQIGSLLDHLVGSDKQRGRRVRPRAFAVLRLMASSYHLFCLDVRRFDYRPPLLNIVPERRPHPFRRALIVRWNLQT